MRLGGNRNASRGERLRGRLFDKFAANLSIWFPDTSDIFVCPVCRTQHTRESLMTRPPLLALGHIVPQALGGGSETLVCRACESDLSAAFDRAVADEKNYHEWQSGKRTADAFASQPEGNITFVLNTSEDRPRLTTDSNRSSPEAREALIGRLTSERGTKFTVRIPTYHEQHRDLSYLYHAFLAMFDAFGYEFAFAREMNRVRALLLGNERANLRSILRSMKATSTDMPELPPHINVASSEDHPACFFVALPPMLLKETARGVILPGPDPESVRYFDSLVDSPEPYSGEMQLTWVPREKLLSLDDPYSRGQMRWIFREFSGTTTLTP